MLESVRYYEIEGKYGVTPQDVYDAFQELSSLYTNVCIELTLGDRHAWVVYKGIRDNGDILFEGNFQGGLLKYVDSYLGAMYPLAIDAVKEIKPIDPAQFFNKYMNYNKSECKIQAYEIIQFGSDDANRRLCEIAKLLLTKKDVVIIGGREFRRGDNICIDIKWEATSAVTIKTLPIYDEDSNNGALCHFRQPMSSEQLIEAFENCYGEFVTVTYENGATCSGFLITYERDTNELVFFKTNMFTDEGSYYKESASNIVGYSLASNDTPKYNALYIKAVIDYVGKWSALKHDGIIPALLENTAEFVRYRKGRARMTPFVKGYTMEIVEKDSTVTIVNNDNATSFYIKAFFDEIHLNEENEIRISNVENLTIYGPETSHVLKTESNEKPKSSFDDAMALMSGR